MGIFQKNPNETAYAGGEKHWSDVIKNGDLTGELLIWRAPEEDFNTNSTLIVQPGEEAIFIKEGHIESVSENGKYNLKTDNYPVISRLRNWFTGGVSTFNCVVYFVKKAHSKEILWGTATPLQVEDPTYGTYLKVKAYGAAKIQIDNGAKFLEKLAGNVDGVLQDELVVKYFSNEMQQYIKSSFKRAIKSAGTDVIDIVGEPVMLAQNLQPIIQEIYDAYGIKLVTFSIGGASVEENDEGYRHIMEMKRNMNEARLYGDNWGRFQSKEILTNVSLNPGAGGVAAAGAGLGMGMAAGGIFGNMAQQMFSPMNPQPQQQPVQPQPSGRFTQKPTEEPKENPVEKIKQLKEMLDLGAISQAEFDIKKQEILSRM
jgi:membrane protease subunit (stomatin/prohibitin family)